MVLSTEDGIVISITGLKIKTVFFPPGHLLFTVSPILEINNSIMNNLHVLTIHVNCRLMMRHRFRSLVWFCKEVRKFFNSNWSYLYSFCAVFLFFTIDLGDWTRVVDLVDCSMEVWRKRFFLDQLIECHMWSRVRHHDLCNKLFTIGQTNSFRNIPIENNFLNVLFRENLRSVALRALRNCLGHGSHSSVHVAPGTFVFIQSSNDMMEKHVSKIFSLLLICSSL